MTKLRLPDVTLTTVTSVAHELHRMALEECMRKVEFGAVLIISDEPSRVVPSLDLLPAKTPLRTAQTNKYDLAQANKSYWYDLPIMVTTSHFLIVHHDSWVLHLEAWSDDWLDYDYIGAPWWHGGENNVGNGGFSLRSSRLAKHVASNPDLYPFGMPEDDVLCRKYGARLKAEGFKFASTFTAGHFAFERIKLFSDTGKPLKTFGYHGQFNWPEILNDEQIAERMKLATPEMRAHIHTTEMCDTLRALGRRADFSTSGARVYAA